VVPIPDTKRRGYLAENICALDISLTPDDLHAIEEAAPKGAPLGDRYPPHMMQTINH
jgi:diketogulonate reductase-like aldo/keto reductase